MSLPVLQNFNFQVLGDGSTTTVSIDYRQAIKTSFSAGKYPVSVYSASGGPSTPSTSLSGTVVTFTWATAPAVGVFNLLVYLTFNGV